MATTTPASAEHEHGHPDNAMVILNLTWFPNKTYPCAGRRI